MPCNQIRELELIEEKKRRAMAKRRKEKEKARKEKELKEARARVERAREVIREQAKKKGWNLTEVSLNNFVASKPYSNDKIKFEVLKTGVIKTVTDVISMVNHQNAEAFLGTVADLLKGKWKIRHRYPGKEAHAHMHATGQTHTH
jgi:ElaB/YqjD/DUF883 family membrane-anchored ribosome-binding protein